MKLTSKEQDYLETIYRLAQNSDSVGVSDIARERGVTLPTVVSAISRLKDNGLITQEHYGKIFLKPDGEKLAHEIYRTHKTLRAFLAEVLKLSADKSESEACRLEHAVSKETISRLVAFMETYQNCPMKDPDCQDKYSEALKNKLSN